MDAKAAAAKDSINDEEVLFQRLQPNHRPVVEEAPSQPKFEVPDVDDGKTALEVEDGDEERTVAGRKTMKMPKERETVRLDGDEDDAEVKEELNDILKRSPSTYPFSFYRIPLFYFRDPVTNQPPSRKTVIIFSKSYCPHSMKAKSILLEKYTIVPSPFVVELDKHPLGPKLQNLLAENTKRRTVPNVLISGRTIGGGDEISSLHEEGELVETIRSLGGKQMMEVSLKDQTGE